MLIASLLAAAAVAALPADLAKAAHDYDAAQVASDKAALERLLAPDYVLHNSSGQVQDKASFIADQVAPGYKLEPFTVVTSEYSAGTLSGVIGVIGPTRMPYDKVIALVEHTSRLVSDLLC